MAPKRKTKNPTDVDAYVGGQIRAARLAFNPPVSQTKLAAALNVTFQQVQKYEKGTNRIAPSRLDIVAKVLERPISYFYPPAERPINDDDRLINQFFSTPGARDLATNYVAIKDQVVRNQIVDLSATVSRRK